MLKPTEKSVNSHFFFARLFGSSFQSILFMYLNPIWNARARTDASEDKYSQWLQKQRNVNKRCHTCVPCTRIELFLTVDRWVERSKKTFTYFFLLEMNGFKLCCPERVTARFFFHINYSIAVLIKWAGCLWNRKFALITQFYVFHRTQNKICIERFQQIERWFQEIDSKEKQTSAGTFCRCWRIYEYS